MKTMIALFATAAFLATASVAEAKRSASTIFGGPSSNSELLACQKNSERVLSDSEEYMQQLTLETNAANIAAGQIFKDSGMREAGSMLANQAKQNANKLVAARKKLSTNFQQCGKVCSSALKHAKVKAAATQMKAECQDWINDYLTDISSALAANSSAFTRAMQEANAVASMTSGQGFSPNSVLPPGPSADNDDVDVAASRRIKSADNDFIDGGGQQAENVYKDLHGTRLPDGSR